MGQELRAATHELEQVPPIPTHTAPHPSPPGTSAQSSLPRSPNQNSVLCATLANSLPVSRPPGEMRDLEAVTAKGFSALSASKAQPWTWKGCLNCCRGPRLFGVRPRPLSLRKHDAGLFGATQLWFSVFPSSSYKAGLQLRQPSRRERVGRRAGESASLCCLLCLAGKFAERKKNMHALDLSSTSQHHFQRKWVLSSAFLNRKYILQVKPLCFGANTLTRAS